MPTKQATEPSRSQARRPGRSLLRPLPGPASRRKALLLLTTATGLLVTAGCTPVDDRPQRSEDAAPALAHSLVQRDLADIISGGTLRVAMRYNSSAYFIHKGGHAGFEYELLSHFARPRGMSIEVVIPNPGESLLSLLNSGRVDVLATGEPLAEQIARHGASTRPYGAVSKVLIVPQQDRRADGLTALTGLVVHLPLHSPDRLFLQTLRLEKGLRFYIVSAGPLVESEELIARVSRGQIPATVANSNLARAALSYLSGARIAANLGGETPLTWLVRQNSPALLAELNDYIGQRYRMTSDGPWRDRIYGILYERYYGEERSTSGYLSQDEDRPDKTGNLSPWDEYFQASAESLQLDWRLVAALAYQESRFDPEAISSAGATGLMQVLPSVAGRAAGELLEPQINIQVGAHILRDIFDSYAYLDSLDRLCFTLATYHAGVGHMADARRLAIDAGLNPNRWRGSVREVLPRLMEQRYFSQTRHGFYRGSETVSYVEAILHRYRMYRRLLRRDGQVSTVLRSASAGVSASE
jgi:membrane-bound lytic murein transglycosylase F